MTEAWAASTMTSIFHMLMDAPLNLDKNMTYLDWLIVDKDTVEGGGTLSGSIGLGEKDVGDTTADAVWSVRDLDSLDWASGLGEVLLLRGSD